MSMDRCAYKPELWRGCLPLKGTGVLDSLKFPSPENQVPVRKRCASTAVLVLCSTVTLFSASTKAQDSVADAARKNRAKVSSKRVWTNDDIASANSPEELALQREKPESASEAVHKFRVLDKEELGAGVLQQAGAPNVDFPNR